MVLLQSSLHILQITILHMFDLCLQLFIMCFLHNTWVYPLKSTSFKARLKNLYFCLVQQTLSSKLSNGKCFVQVQLFVISPKNLTFVFNKWGQHSSLAFSFRGQEFKSQRGIKFCHFVYRFDLAIELIHGYAKLFIHVWFSMR